MENPTWQLAPIVARLFELGEDQSLPARSREAALQRAHQLRAQLDALLAKRNSAATAEYSEAIELMASLRALLESADSSPALIPGAVQRAGDLAAMLGRLLDS
jgi:hypothetical protein